jgi:hypothetical protein
MNGLFREMAIGSIKDKRSLADIPWLDGMGNVNDIGLRIGAQNHALHDGNIGIAKPKIGGQRYYASHPLFSRHGLGELGYRYGKNNEDDAEDDGELE